MTNHGSTPNTGEWSLSEFCKTPTCKNIAGVEVMIRSNNVEHVRECLVGLEISWLRLFASMNSIARCVWTSDLSIRLQFKSPVTITSFPADLRPYNVIMIVEKLVSWEIGRPIGATNYVN
jgi:hypothetical protein